MVSGIRNDTTSGADWTDDFQVWTSITLASNILGTMIFFRYSCYGFSPSEFMSASSLIDYVSALLAMKYWHHCSGFWILLPAYMTHTFGRDILQGLAIASGDLSSGPVRAAASLKADWRGILGPNEIKVGNTFCRYVRLFEAGEWYVMAWVLGLITSNVYFLTGLTVCLPLCHKLWCLGHDRARKLFFKICTSLLAIRALITRFSASC